MPATAQRPQSNSTDALHAFQDAEAKGGELTEHRSRLEREIARLEHEFQERFQGAGLKGNASLNAEAAELVGDEQQKAAADKNRQAADMQDRLRQLRRELEVAKKALEMFYAPPNGPWKLAQLQASREVCRQRAAEHRELAIGVARAAVRLLQASEAEQRFRDELKAEQLRIADPIFPAVWKPVETLRESINRHLNDLNARFPGVRQEILDSEAIA